MSSTVLDPGSTMTLQVAPDLRLRDLAQIYAQLGPQYLGGVSQVRLRGAVSMTEGARLALIATHDRMQREGIELVLESG